MPEETSKIKINLSGRPKDSFSSIFLKWAVNTGRIIIVATELVALGALFYRFTVDRKIIDLHDQIKREEIFVKSQAAKEKDYRSIQERLANIKNTDQESSTKIDIMNKILASVSSGEFGTSSFSLNENSISLSATSFSYFPINAFIEDLKQNKEISAISVDEITSGEKGIGFKLLIELKKQQNI